MNRVILQRFLQKTPLDAFIRFAFAGVPGVVVAFAANFFFVEFLRWPKPLAYAIVVWLQLSIGFFLCKIFVFSPAEQGPALRMYVSFAARIGLIRAADWALYAALVEILHVPYLLAQSVNLLIFPILKFLSVRSLFRGRELQ